MQNFPHWPRTFIVACLLLAACGREQEPQPTPEPIVVEPGGTVVFATEPPAATTEPERALLVGIVGPESGADADYGQAIYRGAQLAVEKLNDTGGIGGQALQLVHYDNAGEAGQTMDIVQHLIDQKVMAIISAPTGWATFGPTHLTNDSDTILISVGSRRRIARSGDYIFQLSLTDEIATDRIIRYSRDQLRFKRFALVTTSDYDYSLDVAASFKKALGRHGGELVAEADTYDTYTGQHDVEAVVTHILGVAGSLDAVIFTGSPAEAAALILGLQQNNIHLPLVAGEDLFSEALLEQTGTAAVGSLVYATYPDRSLPQTKAFISSYREQNKIEPDRFAALAFDAATLLGQALRESGSRHSSVVRETLLRSTISDGVTGSSSFSERGSSIKEPVIYKVIAGSGRGQFAQQH